MNRLEPVNAQSQRVHTCRHIVLLSVYVLVHTFQNPVNAQSQRVHTCRHTVLLSVHVLVHTFQNPANAQSQKVHTCRHIVLLSVHVLIHTFQNPSVACNLVLMVSIGNNDTSTAAPASQSCMQIQDQTQLKIKSVNGRDGR